MLFVVLICLGVLMRRQWEEHERFAFPLMQVPLAMLESGEGRIAPVFRSRLLAAGFAIPSVVWHPPGAPVLLSKHSHYQPGDARSDLPADHGAAFQSPFPCTRIFLFHQSGRESQPVGDKPGHQGDSRRTGDGWRGPDLGGCPVSWDVTVLRGPNSWH